jgi:hypothetical protein
MLEVRPRKSLSLDESQAVIFSHRTVKTLIEEEADKNVWNVITEYTPAGAAIDLSDWSRDAVTAEDYNFVFSKSLVHEDPATELNTLEKNEDQVATLIAKIRSTHSIPDRENIARRLYELLEDIKEEEPESSGMSLESLRSFYSFLQMYSYLKKPAIGLTAANDIYISWKSGPNRVFSINFLPSDLPRFAIIIPGPRSEQQERTTGSASIESLIERAKPWGVLDWATREGR